MNCQQAGDVRVTSTTIAFVLVGVCVQHCWRKQRLDLRWFVMRCIALHRVEWFLVDLICRVLCCIALHCDALLRIDLLCVVLRYIVLHRVCIASY